MGYEGPSSRKGAEGSKPEMRSIKSRMMFPSGKSGLKAQAGGGSLKAFGF